MRSLIISTEPNLTDTLRFILTQAGYNVQEKRKISEVLPTWLENPYDLVLLTGISIENLQSDIQSLRIVSEAPILVLIEAPRESVVISLLQAGADLVMELPVGPQLLIMYCQTLLRRASQIPTYTLPILDLGQIRLEPTTRTVKLENQESKRLTQISPSLCSHDPAWACDSIRCYCRSGLRLYRNGE